MTANRLDLLGGFRLTSGGGHIVDIPAKKNRALLGILAMAPRCEATRDRLAALLWSDRGEEQAKNSLRQALASLHKDFASLDAEPLALNGDRIALNSQNVVIDVVEFLGASASADQAALRQAAALYAGPFLDGLNTADNAFEDWLRHARADLAARAVKVLESLAGSLSGAERIVVAERLVELDPLREASHLALIQAHLAEGQPALAIKQYEACKLLLKRELDVEPSDELQQLRRNLNSASRNQSVASVLKPVLAVLPFKNLSGYPSQEYFADGIVEEIITALSHFRSLVVIARHSSFQYKEKIVDVKRIGNELGAQFVVEGSVRKAGDKLRIAAQLVDAASGSHVWGQRFDCDIKEVFTVEDEVTTAIVATIVGQVQAAEIGRARRRRTDNVAAYDSFLRGLEHYHRYSGDDIVKARQFLESAIELDPDFTQAYALLSTVLVELCWAEVWESRDRAVATLELALLAGQRAVTLDASDARCHCALGFVHLARKSFDLAAYHLNTAAKLNPNDATVLAHRSDLELYTGRSHEALCSLELAMKLHPIPPNVFWEIQGMALYQLKRYAEAANSFERAIAKMPHSLRFLAACYARMGRLTEAGVVVDQSLRLQPKFTLETWAAIEPYQSQVDLDHMLVGMRMAGLPE